MMSISKNNNPINKRKKYYSREIIMLLKTNDSCSHVVKKCQARDKLSPVRSAGGKQKPRNKHSYYILTASALSLVQTRSGGRRYKLDGHDSSSQVKVVWAGQTKLQVYSPMSVWSLLRILGLKKKSINSVGGMCERREEGRARANKRLLTASRPRAVGLTDLIDVDQAPPPLVSIGRWSARKETHGGWRKVQMREFPSSSAGTTSPPASSAVLVISKQIEKCPPVLANCQTFNSPRQN